VRSRCQRFCQQLSRIGFVIGDEHRDAVQAASSNGLHPGIAALKPEA
jgi:hypothetical protein